MTHGTDNMAARLREFADELDAFGISHEAVAVADLQFRATSLEQDNVRLSDLVVELRKHLAASDKRLALVAELRINPNATARPVESAIHVLAEALGQIAARQCRADNGLPACPLDPLKRREARSHDARTEWCPACIARFTLDRIAAAAAQQKGS